MPVRPASRSRAGQTSASTVSRSGLTDHSSCSSRTSVWAGFSPSSTEPPAPSAQRPDHVASQSARRPASQRPSAARTTHSATGSAPRRRTEPQRPADRLELQRSRSVDASNPAAAPRARRGSASPARAAAASAGRRRRSRPARRRTAPGASSPRPGTEPGTAREDAGGEAHGQYRNVRLTMADKVINRITGEPELREIIGGHRRLVAGQGRRPARRPDAPVHRAIAVSLRRDRVGRRRPRRLARGRPGRFRHVLDERTLLLPDRPGNRIADTFPT